MNPFATLHAARQTRTAAARLAKAQQSVARATRLSRLLKDAFRQDGEALYPLLARILDVHMHRPHADSVANGDIRDRLDEIQLLISLEIESEGLLQAPDEQLISFPPRPSIASLVAHRS